MKTTLKKRILSWICAFSIIFNIIPAGFADDGTAALPEQNYEMGDNLLEPIVPDADIEGQQDISALTQDPELIIAPNDNVLDPVVTESASDIKLYPGDMKEIAVEKEKTLTAKIMLREDETTSVVHLIVSGAKVSFNIYKPTENKTTDTVYVSEENPVGHLQWDTMEDEYELTIKPEENGTIAIEVLTDEEYNARLETADNHGTENDALPEETTAEDEKIPEENNNEIIEPEGEIIQQEINDENNIVDQGNITPAEETPNNDEIVDVADPAPAAEEENDQPGNASNEDDAPVITEEDIDENNNTDESIVPDQPDEAEDNAYETINVEEGVKEEEQPEDEKQDEQKDDENKPEPATEDDTGKVTDNKDEENKEDEFSDKEETPSEEEISSDHEQKDENKEAEEKSDKEEGEEDKGTDEKESLKKGKPAEENEGSDNKENPDQEEDPEDVNSDEAGDSFEYTFNDNGITLTATAVSGVPETAVLVAQPVASTEERIADYKDSIASAYNVDSENVRVWAYDIHFEQDNEEIEVTDANVHMTFALEESIGIEEHHEAPFYHVENENLVRLVQNTADNEGVISSFSFDVTSCSDFVLADVNPLEEGEETEEAPTGGTYTYTGNGITIVATTLTENEIPPEANLVADVVSASEERIAGYRTDIAGKHGVPEENIVLYVYDIHFEDEGEELPVAASYVHLKITKAPSLAIEENHLAPFYHVVDGELVEVLEDASADGAVSTFEFDVYSCSDFILADVDTTDYDIEHKYAILYSNGDLVFQDGKHTDPTKGTADNIWLCTDGKAPSSPWTSSKIKRVYVNTSVKLNSSQLFSGCTNLQYVYGINNFEITYAGALKNMFYNCSKLKHVEGLAEWDTSMANSLNYTFYGCQVLDNIHDIDSWNLTLSETSGLNYAFYNCKRLEHLDLSGWDLSKITALTTTFYECNYLRSVKFGNIFSAVTSDISLSSAFMYCYSLEDVDGLFDTCANAYLYRAFYYCRSLTGPIDLSGMTIRSMESAFYECSKLRSVDMSNAVLRGSWMYAFYNCGELRKINLDGVTSNTTSGNLNATFYNTKRLSYLDLSCKFFNNGNTSSYSNTFYNSKISKISLSENFKFVGSALPSGNWKRQSTGEVYTAAELKAAWNSSMADTYEKVNVVTFDGNGGEVSATKVIKQMDEVMEESDFPTVTLTGYTFKGWFTEKTGGTELHAGDPVTQSIYYAQWDENTYTLVLKRNVEDDPNDTEVRIPLTYTEIYQLSPTQFENEDKVIQGWTTNADGTGTFYGADERISWLSAVDDGEAFLYAKWGRTHDAVISFDSQGGSDVDEIVIERGQTLKKEEFVTSKREGYTFDGWWTDPEEGERWDTTNHLITGSVQLYAHWNKNPVVSFVPNGGWISTFSQEVPYGGKLESLPWGDDRITKLIGFFTEQEPGAGEQLTTSTVFTEDATYYAHWGYQPTFNLAGGKYDKAFNTNTVYPISENNLLEITEFPEVSFDGYTLTRWKRGDGTTVEIGDVIDISVYPEIIAEWEHDNTVKVTFDANGGYLSEYYWSNNGSSHVLSKVYEMEKDTALGYYPDAYKYVGNKRLDFLGWYDADDNLYTPESIITEDITLYAKYKATSNVQYKFVVAGKIYRATGDSYTTNNANNTITTTIYRNMGDEIGIIPGLESPTGASLNGKYLEGWYSDPDPFEEDGVTLKEGVEKLTATTVKTENSTWYPNIINNVVDKYSDVAAYKYYAEWVNASSQDVSNVDNNLNFHPQSYNDQTASLHIHFELNSQVAEVLPTGSIRITVPKYIWKDWDGNDVGSVNLSTQIPQYPKKQNGMFFSYAEDGEGNYILVNNAPISGGAGVDLTLSYTVDPVKVPGGAVDRNKDYVPGYEYYSGTVPVLFEIDKDTEISYREETVGGKTVTILTNEFEADTQENIDLTIEMHTFVDPGISKAASKLYYEWQSIWGERPEDASDYFYMYWSITSATSNNQPYTLKLTEDTVHDGTIVYVSTDYEKNPYVRPATSRGTTYAWNYLYVVTKHPKTLLDPIPETGLLLENQARLTVDWKSGYKTELVSYANYTMYKWEYTIGEFDKTNAPGVINNYSNNGYRAQNSSAMAKTGAQDLILNGSDVQLEWELHYEGVSADTPILWDEESQTYSRLQRVIAIADGINGDLMYSSGEPYAKYVWEPTTGNFTLTDNDYTINKLRIFVNEYDGSYHNSQWGGPTLRSDYGLWKDIDVYVRYRGSNRLVFYKSVRPWATDKKNVGQSGQYGYTDVTLPPDVVGWEVRYPTKYFSTYLQVSMVTTLHATADVKSYIQHDVLGGYNSEIKNRGYCNIWTSDNEMEDPDNWDIRYMLGRFTEDTWAEPKIFFHVTDWTGGLNSANKETWEFTKSQGSMYCRKYASSHGKVLFDVERGIQENPMAITGWNYNSTAFTPVKTGRFYDLLPRGATVDKSTLFGILGSNNSTGSPYGGNPADSYTTYKDNTSSHLPKEYYNVQFVEDWENSGRTMMIIDYTAPTDRTNTATFFYLLRMTYQDVVSYGTSVRNDLSFIDTTRANKYSYAYSAQSTLGEDAYLYDNIHITNDYVSYSSANTDYIPVDAYSWGFYKSVDTQGGYVTSDITIPNNIYTYKINYAQSDYARVDSMVFFDVLERGAYQNAFTDPVLEKESEWYGTFESIDVTPLKSLIKEGSSTSNPAYCAPVIYYSTKNREDFTGTDWNVENAETWTTVMPDKSAITAIAVDCRKATDGDTFAMFGRQSATFYIKMRSPTNPEYVNKKTVNQGMFKGNVNNEPSEATSDTEVTLTEEEPEIHKTSDPETGTEEDPKIISSGDDLTYTITVKNMNTEFVVPNIVVEDKMPDGVQVDTSNIKVHFGNTANALKITESPRASMIVREGKMIFTINSLSPEETCYLIVPTKAKASGGQIIVNTAVITKVNDVEKEINSETTYHKVEFDIIFSKQSDTKKLVIGATLQLWDTDANQLVEEWITENANKKIRLHTGHYLLKETEVPEGYAISDDIAFEIKNDGTVLYENGEEDTKVIMVDVLSTTVKGIKVWKYDEEADRPESITIKLMRRIDGEDTPSYSGKSVTISAADNWEYDFGLVPKYDNEGNEYIYTLEEEPVSGYTAYYSSQTETNGLELRFSSKTSTYNSSDYFILYYKYGDKIFGKKYYGTRENENNPAGTTIRIPATEFWVAFVSDGSNNDYGFKFDQILPVQMDVSTPVFTRYYLDSWVLSATAEEYTGSRFPETDHEYFIYEKVLMHYTRDMEGYLIDVVNTKDSEGFDIPFNKVNEDDEKIGGIVLKLTSDPEVGDAEIDPIEWTTVEGESHIEKLLPGHYILHEVSSVSGYLFADDIHFMVDGEGKVVINDTELDSVDMLDMYREQPYPFKKAWMDDGYESFRPVSQEFELVRKSDDEVVQTKALTAENAINDTVWEGEFDPVPMVDEEWNPIEYYVREVENSDYRAVYGAEEINGFWVTFTQDSYIGYGKLYIVLMKPDHGGYLGGEYPLGYLNLNADYGYAYLEESDMAGKSFYVPNLDNLEEIGFWCSWPSDKENIHLEIASIVPTTDAMPYELLPADYHEFTTSNWLDIQALSKTTGKNYPDIDYKENESRSVGLWNFNMLNSDEEYDGSIIVNMINKQSVPFQKTWNDAGHESERPETLVFDLYNENDPDTVVATKEVTVADKDYVFENVPIYNADGSYATYIVKERSTDKYDSYNSSKTPKGFLVTFSEDSTLGTGNLYIQCISSATSGDFVTNSIPLTFYSPYGYNSNLTDRDIAGTTVYVPVIREDKPGFVINVYDSSKTAHVKVESIIPVDYVVDKIYRSAQNGPYTIYKGKTYEGDEYPEIILTEDSTETSVCAMYMYKYKANAVTNVYNRTEVPIIKVWEDFGETANRPESITFDIYNVLDDTEIIQTVEMVGAECQTSDDEWSYTVKDLPRFNEDGSIARYKIVERPVDGYKSIETKPTGMLVTFSKDTYLGANGYTYSTYIYTVRNNYIADQIAFKYQYPGDTTQSTATYLSSGWISDRTLYIPVYNDVYEFVISKSSAYKVEIENIQLTTREYEVHYNSYNGSNIANNNYPVFEGTSNIDVTSTSGYAIIRYNGVGNNAYTDGSYTITNESDVIQIPVSKVWADTGYEDERPESITFEVFNVLDPDTTVQSVVLTPANETSAYEWQATVHDLPRYNGDGTLAEYTVREIGVDGYKTSAKKPTGMYIYFSRDTLPGYWGSSVYNTIENKKEYIQVYSVDKLHGNYRYAYRYPGINDDNGYGNLYKKDLEALNYRVYIPLQEDDDYEFVVYTGWSSDMNTVKVEKVELTTDDVPYVAQYYSGSSMPRQASAPGAPYSYSEYMVSNIYTGHGECDMTGKYLYRYIYDGAEPYRANISGQVVNEITKTEVEINKIWADVGYEDKRPASITINIYNVNDTDTIVKTVELTTEDATGDYEWHKEIKGLPKYNDDGSLAIYRYEEAEVENYVSVPSKPTGLLVTFTEDSFEYVGDSSYIQLWSVYGDTTHQMIRNEGDPANIYPADFRNRASRTFYIPIAKEGQYEFAIYKSNNWWANKLEIESVQLTSIPQPYTVVSSSTNTLPTESYPFRYYKGHGSFEIRHESGYARYVYDAVSGDLTNLSDGNVTNEIDLTDIPITKTWADAEHESERPEEIVIDVYNVRDLETVVKTATLTNENATDDYTWSITVKDLPKYNDDLSLAQYVIKERETENYIASYSKPTGMLVTVSSDSFANDRYGGYVTFYALSKGASKFRYTLSYPINGSTYSSIYRNQLLNQRTFYVPIVDEGYYAFGMYVYRYIQNNTAPNNPVRESEFKIERVELTSEPQTYTTNNMGMPINGYIPEANIYVGDGSEWDVPYNRSSSYYVYIYDGPESSVGSDIQYGINNMVTNEYNKVDRMFKKFWNDEGNNEYRPDSLVFQVYNERTPETTIQEKTVTSAEAEEGDAWTVIFEELPKYNPDGTRALYFIREKETPDGYVGVDANKNIKGFLLQFSEDSDITNGSLYIWQSDGTKALNYISPSSDNSPAYWYGTYYPIRGKKVYVPVYTPGVYEFWIQLNRNTQPSSSDLKMANYTLESIVPVYEDDLPTYILTGPTGPSHNGTSTEATRYEVVNNATSLTRDAGITNGYSTIYTLYRYDVDSTFDGIVNTLQKSPVEINKQAFEKEYLPGARLQILKSDKSTVVDEWTTVADENHITELPYGTYYLHEVSAPEGYEISEDMEFKVATDGTVSVAVIEGEEKTYTTVGVVSMFDNELTSIPFDKYWDDAEFVQYRPTAVTYDLYDSEDPETIVQTVELNAENKVGTDTSHWAGVFENVPKCHADGTEIQYIIRERNVSYYNTEYAGEHLIVNSSDSFSYTPKPGLQINWTKDARTNGPLCVIWKDKMSGQWYMTGYGLSTNNSPTYLNAQEAYLIYRSYAYYTGIAIENVEPSYHTPTFTGGTLATGTASSDRDAAIQELLGKFQGTSNYWNPDDITSLSFVDGSNGYRDRVAGTPYLDKPVIQLVKVSISPDKTYVSRGVSGQDILNAEGFRVMSGDDQFAQYGPYAVIWRDKESGKLAYNGSAGRNAGDVFDIPSKEFYLFFKDCGGSGSIRNAGITVKSVKALSESDEWITGTVTDYETIEEFMQNIYSSYSEDLQVVDGRYGVSSDVYTTENRVFSFVYSAEYESFTSTDPTIDDYEIRNTFDYHAWPVPISKKTAGGSLLAGSHLKLYKEDGTFVSEWDSGSGSAQIETLWPGNYVLKETGVPTGYIKAEDIAFTLTPIGEIIISSVEQEGVSMIDEAITGDLTVHKYRDATYTVGNAKVSLSGAKLELRVAGTDTVVKTGTTGNDGTVTWTDIPYGVYDIYETQPPAGYQNVTEAIATNIAITTIGQNVEYAWDLYNKPVYGSVSITKSRSDDETELLNGVRFELLKSDKATRATDVYGVELPVVETGTSGWADGFAKWDNVEYGTYYIHEISTINGYYLDSTSSDAYVPAYVSEQGTTQSKTMKASNIPQTWSLKIHKKDEITTDALSDATFKVTRTSGIDFDNPDKQQEWTITTNTNGIAEIAGLTAGVYKVEETVLPTHYTNSTPFSTTITLSTSDRTVRTLVYPTIEATNTPNKGKLKITKKDGLSGLPMQGVQFYVYRYNNGTDVWAKTGNKVYIETITTDENGIAESSNLVKGLYYIEEKAVPEGYQADIKTFDEVKILPDETTERVTTNTPIRGKIAIDKTDIITSTKLKGAVFEITRVSGIPGRNDTLGVVGRITTDANGHAESGLLTYGVYEVKEITAPSGYYAPVFEAEDADDFRSNYPLDTVMTFTISADNITEEQVYTRACKNVPKPGKLKITKKDSLTSNPIPGVKFDLYRYDNGENIWEPTENKVFVETITTDNSGVAESGSLTAGLYYIEEKAVPEGYQAAKATFDNVKVEYGGTKECEAVNVPIQGKIAIDKSDIQTSEKLAGAVLEITRVSGIPGRNDTLGVVGTITTDTDGHAESGLLTYGVYEVKEKTAPAGYYAPVFAAEDADEFRSNYPLDTVMTFTINEDNITEEKVYTKPYKNVPKPGKFKVTKTDSLNDNPIAGVKFDIYRYDNGKDIWEPAENKVLVETITTDETGIAESGELAAGLYYVEEKAAPEGYQATIVKFDSVRIESGKTAKQAATNMPVQGRIVIDKKDIITSDKLAGTVFEIKRISGIQGRNDKLGIVGTITTDENGHAESELLTYGVYELREITAPDHYYSPVYEETDATEFRRNYPMDQVLTVEINKDDKTEVQKYDYVLSNVPKPGKIQVKKTDSVYGYNIEGVKFDVYRYNNPDDIWSSDGEKVFVETITTDENGIAISNELQKGLYYVKEKEAPAGYVEDLLVFDNIEVHSDETAKAEGTNTPALGKVIINKYGNQLIRYETKEKSGHACNVPVMEKQYLAGAVYEVRAAEEIFDVSGAHAYDKDELADTITTTVDGNNESKLLPFGKYYLVEVSAPDGFICAEEPVQFELAYKDQYTAVCEETEELNNEYLAYEVSLNKQILITKSMTGEDGTITQEMELKPGAGFMFGLFTAEQFVGTDATLPEDSLVDIGVTDENGRVVFSGTIPHGSYYVKEIETLDGWLLNKTVMPVSITYISKAEDRNVIEQNITQTVINDLDYNTLKIIKKDPIEKHPVAYAKIEVTAENGTVIWRGQTDKNGEITGIPVIPGTYTVKEIEAPEGYLLNSDPVDVTVESEEEHVEIPVEIENIPVRGKINIAKTATQIIRFEETTDKESGITYYAPVYEERPLEGVTIEIHAANDIYDNAGAKMYDKDELVETIVTTADESKQSSELFLGEYYLKEVSAPEGYIVPDEIHPITLKYADQETSIVTAECYIKNEYTPVRINLVKKAQVLTTTETDSGMVRRGFDMIPGEGFVFGLYTAETITGITCDLEKDSLIAVGITDENGGLEFSGVLPFGKYYVKELAAADGWIRTEQTFDVIITKAQDAEDESVIVLNVTEKPIVNEIAYKNITLTKKNIDKAVVPGALIEVYDEDENVICREVTDENGEIRNILVTPGKYTFKEITAPSGYELNTETKQFEVTKELIVVGDTEIVDDYTRVIFTKHDAVSGDPVEGAEFALLGRDGTVVMTAVSDDTGAIVFEKIPYGTYTIEELRPANGYIAEKGPLFKEIVIDGQFVNNTNPAGDILNTPNRVTVLKTDTKGNPLAGAMFELLDKDSKYIMTAVSDDTGHATFSKVPRGAYTIVETKAPEGYLLSKEAALLTVDESYENTDEPLWTFVDKRKEIRFSKKDTSGNPIKGAEFTLINADTQNIAEVVTSNENGEFLLTQFNYGKWILRETKAPEGFNTANDILLQIDENWTEQEPVTIIDIPNHYEFMKTDNYDKPLAGVKFTIEDEQGSVLSTLVSDRDGIVRATGLTPGRYVIREIETINGYNRTDEVIVVEINENYVVPSEMFRLINYPNLQTGVEINNPWMIGGSAMLMLALTALVYVMTVKKRKAKQK